MWTDHRVSEGVLLGGVRRNRVSLDTTDGLGMQVGLDMSAGLVSRAKEEDLQVGLRLRAAGQ